MEEKREHHENDDKKIELMYLALFGNETTGTKGMVETHQQMYKIFVKMDNGFSLVKWGIGSIIVLGLFLGTIKGWIIAGAHHILNK